MTLERDDKASTDESMESDAELPNPQNPGIAQLTTRVGKNPIEIDVNALRQLVDTVKSKLKP
jgi:hypothetical protein